MPAAPPAASSGTRRALWRASETKNALTAVTVSTVTRIAQSSGRRVRQMP